MQSSHKDDAAILNLKIFSMVKDSLFTLISPKPATKPFITSWA